MPMRTTLSIGTLDDIVARDYQSEVKEKIIPFVICDNPLQTKKSAQIKFLHRQGWMSLNNVLSWKEISHSNTIVC
jgi:hypothetical protein